jgi:serine/threonine-protein kinase
MIGEQFGNYRAIELLGEGGMGAVYLAEHPGIGRRVAVKVLHKNYTRDDQLLGRFLNEARAANAIRHPNIIEILDSGVIADGTPFLVMELLEGESLGTRLRRVGPLPVATALDFAYQTASALGAAHKKGIVHRDLKPDNLYVIADPHDTERERIKVLDFGIAKLQQGPSSDSVKTRTGTLMGTPIYMSPEQCRGTRAVDHRSDMYSLGVILFEMLVGHPPFVSEGFGELVNMHLNVAPPSPRAFRRDIPEALDALVLKMLAKSPDDRFADMAELQAALKASGGFAVRSSPDLGRTQPPTTSPVTATKLRETTFSTGVGEKLDAPPGRFGLGAKVFVAGALAAAAVGGLYVTGIIGHGGEREAGGSSPAVATATALPAPHPAPAVTPPPVPVKPVTAPIAAAGAGVTKTKPVTLRVTSQPDGAKVTDDASGAPLGLTPLVLTRPRGGALRLRLEKDGYGGSTRSVALDGDQDVALTLERTRPKPHPHHHAEPHDSNEPAKL